MGKKLRILQILRLWRLLPVYLMMLTLPGEHRDIVLEELAHWGKITRCAARGRFDLFCVLMQQMREYRSLLEYRFRQAGMLRGDIVKVLFPGMPNLSINTPNIGRRLFIQHGFSTVISAKSIGCDCWINQQVTIGYTFAPEPPVIGNGVTVSAGAKVLGQITVGDNAIIGANAVVVKDVPENAVIGGVPGRIIGENVEHRLYRPR